MSLVIWQWPGLTIAAVLPSQDCWCVSHRRHGLQWEFLRPWRSPKMVIGNIKIKGCRTEEELRTGSWFFNRITQSQSQVPWIDLAPCPPIRPSWVPPTPCNLPQHTSPPLTLTQTTNTLQGTDISYLWKRKIIFPTTLGRDMLTKEKRKWTIQHPLWPGISKGDQFHSQRFRRSQFDAHQLRWLGSCQGTGHVDRGTHHLWRRVNWQAR